jgi:cytochrome c2
MKRFYLAIFLLPFILFCSCSGNKKKSAFDNKSVIPKDQKISSGDPFKKNVVESQYFEISGKQDTVIEGDMGTVIVIPKGAFINKKGEPVTDNIKVELAEALTLDQMLLSNLTTYSNGMPLQTGGMIFLNATSGGEKLEINKDKPVYIEIPTGNKKPRMMAYEGQRDENGNMNWINPQALENYLVPVDLMSLDFLPPGFAAEVSNGMPFRSYQTANSRLIDSLYYSLSTAMDVNSLGATLLPATNYNEPYANRNASVVNGKYTSNSYIAGGKAGLSSRINDKWAKDSAKSETAEDVRICGIDPARIKVIRSNAFENTLISTREFETRMRVIHQTCRNDILELYINNLDKNLWQIDAMAAGKLASNDSLRSRFIQFSQLKQTKIKKSGVIVEKLRNFYSKRMEQVKNELAKFKRKQDREMDNEKKEVEHVAGNYKKLLWKREKYRMEKFGFIWTKTGWINIDDGVDPKPWESKSIEIIVDKGKEYDAVYTYFIYTNIKSLYRLNSNDNEHFYTGDVEQRSIPVPKNMEAVVITVAYKNEVPYLGVKEFNTKQDQFMVFLKESSKLGISNAIAQYDDYKSENKIDKDLEFQAFFYKEKKMQEQLRAEGEFLRKLWYKANPCCQESNPDGEALFRANCASCHRATAEKLTGPGLKGVLSRIPGGDWKYDWVHNSAMVIKSGDAYAKKIFDENAGTMQTAFPGLSKADIDAILEYADKGQESKK